MDKCVVQDLIFLTRFLSSGSNSYSGGILSSHIFQALFCSITFSTIIFSGLVSAGDWFIPCHDGEKIIFSSGFDDDVITVDQRDDGKYASIVSNSKTHCKLSNSIFTDPKLMLGKPRIEFEGGSQQERSAEITNDPYDSPSNKVLSFGIKKPNVLGSKGTPVKGRVQMNVYGKQGYKHVKFSVKLLLDAKFAVLAEYPKMIDWLTLSEWWNNIVWNGQDYPFRMTVNLSKKEGALKEPIHFQIRAQTYDYNTKKWDRPIWEEVSSRFPVPFGKWMLLEYELFEGDRNHGRFILNVTLEDEGTFNIFDIHNFTYHPDDPNPDGISHFNPLKLYTNVHVINFVNSHGGSFKVYWDNFNLEVN